MLHNKLFLSSLSLLILFSQTIAYAESKGRPQEGDQLQIQMQQLQAQLINADHRITVLESTKNTANHNTVTLRNREDIQLDATNADGRRTANGHGR